MEESGWWAYCRGLKPNPGQKRKTPRHGLGGYGAAAQSLVWEPAKWTEHPLGGDHWEGTAEEAGVLFSQGYFGGR